jgi:ABC-type branched-subunit amino acid transport system ATPase component
LPVDPQSNASPAATEHDMNVVFSLADRITVLAHGTPHSEDTPDIISTSKVLTSAKRRSKEFN